MVGCDRFAVSISIVSAGSVPGCRALVAQGKFVKGVVGARGGLSFFPIAVVLGLKRVEEQVDLRQVGVVGLQWFGLWRLATFDALASPLVIFGLCYGVAFISPWVPTVSRFVSLQSFGPADGLT